VDESVRSTVASVIVPCRDHAVELDVCLHSLERQSYEGPREIIVVDAAADPAVLAVVEAHPGVGVVREPAGLLPGAARNLGARRARGGYLAFIDADCVAERRWLEFAVAALDTGAIMVGGPVLSAPGDNAIAAADNYLQFYEYTAGRPEGPSRKFPGCNLAVDRAAFQEAGAFDENLRIGEDTALSIALSSAWPTKSRFVPEMRVRHSGRRTLRELCAHHEVFGFNRGLSGRELKPRHRRQGRSRLFLAAAVAGRATRMLLRSARWDPRRLPKVVMMMPLWLTGLVAWSHGFRRGCLAAAADADVGA